MENLEGAIDQLYQAPLSEFIAGRDALVKRLRTAGDKEAAARVKTLQKPSVSAWAVNQVFWAFPKEFGQLLDAAERVEKAQAEGAGSVREASQERRKALTTLLKRAEMTLIQAGGGANANILRRVETTLEALAAYGQAPPPPGPGRLVGDLDPPGFGALSVFGLAAVPKSAKPARSARAANRAAPSPPTKSTSKVENDARQAKLKDLQGRLEKTLREVQILAAEAARAETARSKAEAEARIRRQAAKEAEERWRKATEKAEEADSELARIRERETRATREHGKAREAVKNLQEELEELLD